MGVVTKTGPCSKEQGLGQKIGSKRSRPSCSIRTKTNTRVVRHGGPRGNDGRPKAVCPERQEIGGGYPKSACSETSSRGKGLKITSERTRESQTNGNEKTRGEESWRLATGRGRLRAKEYVCCKSQPFQNLSRDLFPPRKFLPTGDSAAFNGTARQPSPVQGVWLHPPYNGAPRRCPVQPSTPLWPDQVDVLLLLFSPSIHVFGRPSATSSAVNPPLAKPLCPGRCAWMRYRAHGMTHGAVGPRLSI
jgi:hypothetical protein